MSVLARHYSKDFVSLSFIAKETNLSPLFLKHMASKLLSNKLIQSKEGITGGYRLSQKPTEITMARVLSAMSEGMIIPSCNSHECKIKKDKCICLSLWSDVNRKIYGYLENIKLSEFAGL